MKERGHARTLWIYGPGAYGNLGNQKVCGIADYVSGYSQAASTGHETILGSIYVVIEAKRRYKTYDGMPEMILCLSGIQQSREKLRP